MLPKWFSFQEMAKRQAKQQNKLRNLSDAGLIKQSIAAGIVFAMIYALINYSMIKNDLNHHRSDTLISAAIVGVLYGCLSYLMNRYRRNKLRNMEK